MDKSSSERIITLTTDFGLKDPWAGIMKGVILSINPGARVVDITHFVTPQNIIEGAFILSQSCPRFPAGTIHVAVVDPGVGGKRNPILVETEGFFLIGPDNGLFSLVLEKERVKRVIRLTRREYFLPDVSTTFHGRDIFAPVAAHLSLGVDPASFGEPLETAPCTLEVPCPRKIDGSITGEVIYIDTFGNLITNISSHDIEPLKETGPPGRTIIEVIIKGVVIEGISETYTTGVEKQEAPGPLVAVVGSSNLLELACFRAKASEHLDAGAGERVDVRVKKR